MLIVYGLTEAEFFGAKIEREIAPWELGEEEFAITRLVDDLRALPKPVLVHCSAGLDRTGQAVEDLQRRLREVDGSSSTPIG